MWDDAIRSDLAEAPGAAPSRTDSDEVARVQAAPSPRGPFRRFALAALALAAVWWMLNPSDRASWIVGAPAVAMGAATTLLFPAAPSYGRSLAASARFGGYFAWQTVVGATDVALRALNPSLRLNPGFVKWRTRLPEGAPRQLFANAITLLPGTLTARIEGDLLTVHLLDTGADPGLAPLEERVAAMFRATGGEGA